MTAVLERLKLGFGILNRTGLAPTLHMDTVGLVRVEPASREEAHSDAIPLSALIAEIGSLPQHAIVLGACEDGFHCYVDLSDPRPGSILITGDPDSGKTRLMQSILASAMAINSHRQLRYTLLVKDLSKYGAFRKSPHCYQVTLAASEEAKRVVNEMADLAEQRQSHHQPAPAILLAIDDLATLYSNLEADGMDDLNWLLHHGPSVQIWPIATLSSVDLEYVDEPVMQGFGTRLIGKLASQPLASYLSLHPQPIASRLAAGAQFSVLFDDEWITFWIPDIGLNPGEVLR